MKVTKQQVAANRQAILDSASRLYRAHGLSGVGVAEISRRAGLTHGGLYRHFDSKETLVLEACEQALRWTTADLGLAEPRKADFDAHVALYLSPEHRDATAEGCPVAALAADAGRGGRELSGVFAAGVERYIDHFARLIEDANGKSRAKARSKAVISLAAMVGGLLLARATHAADPALSDEILATARAWLCDGEPARKSVSRA
jgi:TetR/AcrR family transcriptional repressor of nem operon